MEKRYFMWKVGLRGDSQVEPKYIPVPALRGAAISMTPGVPVQLGGAVMEHILTNFKDKVVEVNEDGTPLSSKSQPFPEVPVEKEESPPTEKKNKKNKED